MEALLQLMLKWDPVQRGGQVNCDDKKPLCFEMLEQILSMRVSLLADLLFFRFYLKSQPFVRAFEPVLFVSARIYIFLFKLMGFIFINNKNHLYLNNALRAFLQIWNKSLLEHKDELMRFECSKVTVTSQNIFSHYSTIYISVTSVLTQMSVGS